MQSIKQSLLIGVLLACATSAPASVISHNLVGPSPVNAGDPLQIEIVGDFMSDGLIAGGLQLFYDDSLVQFDSFAFNLAVDPFLSCPGAGLCPIDPPGTVSLVWGQFLTDLIPAGAGPTVMGTLDFTALPGADGAASFSLADFSVFTGGWFGAGFLPIATPQFPDQLIVEIEGDDMMPPTPMPLPATTWLFLAGLFVVCRMRKKI